MSTLTLLLLAAAATFANGRHLLRPANDERNIGVTRCTNLPTNLIIQQNGIDIRKFDPTPFVNTGIMNGTSPALGYKNAIFEFTCDQGLTFTDTLAGNKVYQMPDQYSDMYILSHGYLDSTYEAYASATAFAESRSTNFDVGFDYGDFAFGGSYSSQYAHDEETQNNRSLATMWSTQSGIIGQLQPGFAIQVSRAAEALIAAMPDTYEENPVPYCLWVDTYGTHYLDQLTLGGVYRYVASVDNAYKHSATSSTVQWNAEASYWDFISASGGHSDHHEESSEDYQHHSSSMVVFYGGTTSNMHNDSGFDEWWNSVHASPWPIDMQLKPVSDILLLKYPKKAKALSHAQLIYAANGCNSYMEMEEFIGLKAEHEDLIVADSLDT